jgi:hypothetical protein
MLAPLVDAGCAFSHHTQEKTSAAVLRGVVNLSRILWVENVRAKWGILMLYERKWIAVGLLLAAPVLFAQNPPGPTQAPPNPSPQSQAPQAVAPAAPPSPGPAGRPSPIPSTTPPGSPVPPASAVRTGPPVASPSAAPGTNSAVAEPSTAPHPKNRKVVVKELVLPPLPSGPLPQMPMDQIPATPAKVNFQNGLLTISSQNSTLGEILRDVRKLTGAAIDIPQGSGATERVVAHLGPGAPRDVLAILLNGSSFNYVMIGSNTDPRAVSSVILTSKSGDSQPQAASNGPDTSTNGGPTGVPAGPGRFMQPMALNQQPGGRPGRAENGQMADDNDDAKDDESDAADDTAADQAQPTNIPPPGQPDAGANANANPQEQQPDANQSNAGPRTPEQVLEMLRRQQQPGAVAPPPQPPPQQ